MNNWCLQPSNSQDYFRAEKPHVAKSIKEYVSKATCP